jgi:hypothetical protein
VGIGLLFGALETDEAAWGRKKDAPKPDAPAASQPPAAPAAQEPAAAASEKEKVVYTFENEDKMREFTRVWERRQAIILRMRVLQSYWNDDKALLAELDKTLAEQYQLDTAKNYILDPEQRTIVERETPAGPAADSQPAPAPSP